MQFVRRDFVDDELDSTLIADASLQKRGTYLRLGIQDTWYAATE